jgi:hypothetical protein
MKLQTIVTVNIAIRDRRAMLFQTWVESHRLGMGELSAFWAAELEQLNDAAAELAKVGLI